MLITANFLFLLIFADFVDSDCLGQKCRRLPDAVIIGAMKAGTRAVLEFLRLHPDVRAAGKEVHFFDRNYSEGLDYYISHMPYAKKSQIIIEKTPAYFVHPRVPKRIRDTLGANIKLILIVRNPVERLLSEYAQALYKTEHHVENGTIKSFDDLAFFRSKTGNLVVNTSYPSLNAGFYEKHLSRYLNEGFQLGTNIYIVNGDYLRQSPGKELYRLQEFLGLEPLIDDSYFYIDPSKKLPCVKGPVTFQRKDGTYVSGRHRKRPCLGPSKGERHREHPKLTTEQRKSLVNFYSPYNRRFFDLISSQTSKNLVKPSDFASWHCLEASQCT